MQLQCQALLSAAGYQQYEVSAYAQPGRQARHNRNYWEFGDYLGLGAGAHGKLTRPAGIVRTERVKQPREYLADSAEIRGLRQQQVASEQLPFEFMLNALRLTHGFTQALFETRTGLPWQSVSTKVADATQRGLLECQAAKWRPTDMGKRFLNDLVAAFLD